MSETKQGKRWRLRTQKDARKKITTGSAQDGTGRQL